MSRLLQGFACSTLAAAMLGALALAGAEEPTPAVQPVPAMQPSEAGPAKQPAEPASATQPTPAAPPTSVAKPALDATPAPSAGGDTPLYRVVDGNHVDAHTMKGWRTWRAMACDRCHGPNQEGLVGPSLVADLKTMTKEEFTKCVLDGRIDKGMPNFGGVQTVSDNVDALYAFLKGRSDGAIATGSLKEIE
jgi:mono/diheme cytochrome c family protein